jgi:hypothetical protein
LKARAEAIVAFSHEHAERRWGGRAMLCDGTGGELIFLPQVAQELGEGLRDFPLRPQRGRMRVEHGCQPLLRQEDTVKRWKMRQALHHGVHVARVAQIP